MVHSNDLMIDNDSISIAIGGSIYGYGHLKRTLILKKYLRKLGIKNKVIYLLTHDRISGKETLQIKENQIKKLVKIIDRKIVFFDISNPYFFNTLFFKKLFKKIKDMNFKPIFFDNYNLTMFKAIEKLDRKSICICPYIFKKKKMKNFEKIKIFHGLNYFIYDKIHKNYNFKKRLKKILVSCGGLDKYSNSIKIIQEIFNTDNNLEIHLIVGPLFKKEDLKEISIFKKYMKLKIYKNVKNISIVSKKCDLAIVSSGLTKYEMLISGINLAVFCEDKNQVRNNKYFKDKKISHDLSLLKNENDLRLKIDKLINNYDGIFKKININKNKNFNLDLRFNSIIELVKKL